MKLSIITVVRNAEKTIEDTIQSVVNQSFEDYEYIIVDGASTDRTKEIIESYLDKIAQYISEPDKGIYDAMNKGLELAKGDWIYFLGADDVLFSKNTLQNIFDKEPKNADVIYGDVLFKQSNIRYDGEFDAEKLRSKSPCHQAVFYRKELYDIYGKFEIKYKTTADYVLHVKTFCGGAVWQYINEIVALYNETGASYSQKDTNYLHDSFEIRLSGFAGRVSKKSLARIFLSSFGAFFRNHPIKESIKNLRLLFSHISIWNIIEVLYDKYIQK